MANVTFSAGRYRPDVRDGDNRQLPGSECGNRGLESTPSDEEMNIGNRKMSKDGDARSGPVNASPEGCEFAGIIGRCQAMKRVFVLVRKHAQSDGPLTIWGETGAGKERIARAVHDLGPRKGKRFVAVNCAGIQDTFQKTEKRQSEIGDLRLGHEGRVGMT